MAAQPPGPAPGPAAAPALPSPDDPAFIGNGTVGRIKIYPMECKVNGDDSLVGIAVDQARQRYNDTEDPPGPDERLRLRAYIDQHSPAGQQSMWGVRSDEQAILREQHEETERALAHVMIIASGPIAGGPAAIGERFGASPKAIENLLEIGDALQGGVEKKLEIKQPKVGGGED